MANAIFGALPQAFCAISTKGFTSDVARHPGACAPFRFAFRRLCHLPCAAPEISLRGGSLDAQRRLDPGPRRPRDRRRGGAYHRHFRRPPPRRLRSRPYRKWRAGAGAPAMNAPALAAGAIQSQNLAALQQNAALARIFDALDRDGVETRIVGGAVRDALLGRVVREIDLATTAAPALVVERAQAAGIRTILTGVEHGTVTLLVDEATFEVTSLREDVETDGRRARVRFGRDFRADALRRDFTVNALYLARNGQIFDYVGGLEDIKARKLRFIGEPEQRIREDYLRILRFFRFSADFGEGPLDRAGFSAALRERAGLERLSRERVRAELLKFFAARRSIEVAQQMCEAGLLGPLLASAPNPARLWRLAIVEDAAPDPLLRLAALVLELPEDAERLGERL